MGYTLDVFETPNQARIDTIKSVTNTGKMAGLSSLPLPCQVYARHTINADYVEAMQMFAALNTPFSTEALTALAQSLMPEAYPQLDAFANKAQTDVQLTTVEALKKVQQHYKQQLPAAFYQVILTTVFSEDDMFVMFKDEERLKQDRIMDAALHAVLLVTPVHLHIQSIFSLYGLRFAHVMNCGCWMETTNTVFKIEAPEGEEKQAIMQNVIAATLEQYGVNAVTMDK